MNYTVLGAAKSGLAAAELAQQLGENVFVSEYKSAEQSKNAVDFLSSRNIESEFGGHTSKALSNCECIIVSPGIKPTTPIILEAESKGIPIISELEFASRYTSNPIIAITGTNGKTTTTALTEYVINQSGKKAVACGNIGTPLSSLVRSLDKDTIIVAETSSYQLDRIDTFRPKVAVILNITPDHIEYHGNVDNYIAAKWKIFKNQTASDVLLLCADDAIAANAASKTNATVQFFSAKHPVQHGMYCADGNVIVASQHKEEILMRYNELRLPGVHNAYNSMAAALSARAFEVRNENIRDSLMSFSGVEHRLEFVRLLDGIEYINDSKATNVNATWYALQAFPKPIILIAGGRGDNNDYASLDELVRQHVTTVIAIGEEQEAIFNHFCTIIRCIRATSMEDAVQKAKENAHNGDAVLFSPACKSFDMFMNYEHRGHVFKEIVNAL
ncbi:MAG: UDP-N-acetylmuramoyl-L-alanine--D-glutamate ligase [Candidatus Kapaibacterium sp.]